MRKLFSFALLAVGLLVSTNMWAQNVARIGSTNYTDLATALNACQAGETVELLTNITLTGNWTPIVGFKGTLNGKGKTIYGLNISGTEDVGMFSSLDGQTIKNLKIDGATVVSTGNYCGVIAGEVAGGALSYITISNSSVSATGEYAGGLFGAGYSAVTNCIVEDCEISGKEQVGGFIGYMWVGDILNSVASGNAISATSRAGGLIGKLQIAGGNIGTDPAARMKINENEISGTVTATDGVKGGLAGQIMGDDARYEIQKNTIDVANIAYPIGTLRDGQNATFTGALESNIQLNTWTDATLNAVSYQYTNVAAGVSAQTISRRNVAKIGTTEYATLQAAFNAVQDGETIVMIDNITIGSTVTINKANTAMTLDMAGKEWNFNNGTSSIALGLDLQAGTLTIKGFGGMHDTVANATILKVASGATLTLTNGNFGNKGAAAAVENNGTLTVKSAWVNYIDAKAGKTTINGATINNKIVLANAAEVVVLGGTINEIAGASANSKLTVKAGTVTTVSNAGANSFIGGTVTNITAGTNTIEGGKFTALTATGVTYTLKGGLYAANTFIESTPLTPAQGYSVKANTGAFSSTYPYEISQDLIKIVETGVAYGSLESAFAAVADGQTIQLQANIELNGNMNLTLTGKTVTLDLNDKTWKLNNSTEAQVQGMRVYAGNIIVKDGSIIYDAPAGSCNFFEMYEGTKLTIENVTMSSTNYGTSIKSNGEVVINGGEMRSISLGDKATALTVNDGTISTSISLPNDPENIVEVVINGGTIENIATANDEIRGTHVTVNGGTITWLQNSDSTFINDGTITNINGGLIGITDGMFTKLYYETNPDEAPYYRLGSYTINGGVFASDAYVTDEGSRKIEINVPADKEVIANDDPTTMAAYPWKLGVNPYKFYREVAKGNWGTVCYEKKVTRVTNATLYEFVARNSAKTQVMVQEVAVDTITLGRPYLFNALNDEDQIFAYDNNVPATAGSYNGLIGTLVDYETTEAAWVVKGTSIIPAAVKSSVPAFRAYVNVDEIAEDDTVFEDQASAPKRGRLIFNLSNNTTELENVNANVNANGKVMINGQLVIIRDGKMFNAQGAQL